MSHSGGVNNCRLRLYFKIERTEWLSITLVAALVLSAEAMNTAIEFVVDLVSPDYHPLAGKAKDVAAAAVLLAAFGAIIVGLIVFVPKIWVLFGVGGQS